MTGYRASSFVMAAVATLFYCFSVLAADSVNSDNVLKLETELGTITIQLFPDKAPSHVARIKELVREHFYKDISFHRVVKDYIAVTGIPDNPKKGTSDKPNLQLEISDLKHKRGTVSMAREYDKNSANSQFFIVLKDEAPELDGQYSAFGQVVSGMDVLGKLKVGNPKQNGMVDEPTKILKIYLGNSPAEPSQTPAGK